MSSSPIIKLHSTIISITTLLIYILWINITNLILKYPFFSVLLSGLISIGVYQVLLRGISNLVKASWRIKKLFFGKYYLQGIWIGFFEGNNNSIRLFIETFQQDFDKLTVRGESYKYEGGYHGNWVSEASNINISKGILSYSYQTDAIKNSFINPGIAVFNFRRKSQYKPPSEMIGFSSDLYNSNKLKAMEKKISHKTKCDVKESIEEARKYYLENKDIF